MPTVMLTEWDDHFHMACDEEWMEILKQIDLYTNHEHLDYLETFIYGVIRITKVMDDETMDNRLFVLKKLYEKRRQLRQSIETDTGRIFPPYETEFSMQIIYDICCIFVNSRERHHIALFFLDYSHICLPLLDCILQEHSKMFPSTTSNSYGREGFEMSKREFISETIWKRYKFDRFRPGHPTWIPEEDHLHSIDFADDFMDNFVKESDDLLKKTEMIMMHQRTDSLPLLHYAVKHGYPFIIVWFISKLYPDQIGQRDCQGCIPLHYSFREYRVLHQSLPMTFYRWNGIDSDVLYECPVGGRIDDSEYAVPCYLIHTFPEGASFANLQGKLPLHMSLEEGRHRIGARRGGCKDVGYLERRRSFMDRLVKIAPKALATRDVVTHLFPFMIPSVQPGERKEGEEATRKGKDSDDADAGENGNTDSLLLTCTYHILKQNPAVLNNFVDPDDTDISQNTHEKKRAKLA